MLVATDKLIRLYLTKPQVFLRYRRMVLARAVRTSKDPTRMQALQWRLDAMVAKHHHPLGATIVLHSLLLDHLRRLNATYQDPSAVTKEHGTSCAVVRQLVQKRTVRDA